MAGGVVEGPVQVDLVAGAGDAQRAGVVAAEGDEQRALPGRTCSGGQKKQCMKGEKKLKLSFCGNYGKKQRKIRTPAPGSLLQGPVAPRRRDQQTAECASKLNWKLTQRCI